MNYPRCLLASACVWLAGCSSEPRIVAPVSGRVPQTLRASIVIDAVPTGAQIMINGRHAGGTPQTIDVTVDEKGRLREPLTIEPDETTRTIPGVVHATEPNVMHWDVGDMPPKRVRLGIRDPAGNISIGGTR